MPHVALIPFGPPAADPVVWTPSEVLQGSAEQRAWILYEDATHEFSAGIWECDDGKWTVHYTEHEFVHMLCGRIRIVDGAGMEREVGPGDSFVVPAGFVGTWEVVAPARKYFAIYEKKAD
ncbi:MAG: cupin domain-containing protein [Burkholderiaceae bacterium]|jgi:uncharacterized cupin superfamily protein